MDTTTQTQKTMPIIVSLVEFLNSDEEHFRYQGSYYTPAQVNRISKQAIESGQIIEIPGDRYTYEVG